MKPKLYSEPQCRNQFACAVSSRMIYINNKDTYWTYDKEDNRIKGSPSMSRTLPLEALTSKEQRWRLE